MFSKQALSFSVGLSCGSNIMSHRSSTCIPNFASGLDIPLPRLLSLIIAISLRISLSLSPGIHGARKKTINRYGLLQPTHTVLYYSRREIDKFLVANRVARWHPYVVPLPNSQVTASLTSQILSVGPHVERGKLTESFTFVPLGHKF